MNPHLDFLLSSVYDGTDLHPEHLADLQKSGLTAVTIALQKIRTVPPHLIDHILGFRSPRVRSAYLIPFPAPRGGWLDHVRLKVFSDEGGDDVRGEHVEAPRSRERYSYNNGTRKYLVRRAAPPRLFFPLATMATALAGREPLWLCEGPKKALAVAQLGLPTIAIESPWSWHVKGSKDLLADFDEIGLRHRVIELVPDGDYFTNPAIARAWLQLADAFRTRGARPRVVRLPETAP